MGGNHFYGMPDSVAHSLNGIRHPASKRVACANLWGCEMALWICVHRRTTNFNSAASPPPRSSLLASHRSPPPGKNAPTQLGGNVRTKEVRAPWGVSVGGPPRVRSRRRGAWHKAASSLAPSSVMEHAPVPGLKAGGLGRGEVEKAGKINWGQRDQTSGPRPHLGSCGQPTWWSPTSPVELEQRGACARGGLKATWRAPSSFEGSAETLLGILPSRSHHFLMIPGGASVRVPVAGWAFQG